MELNCGSVTYLARRSRAEAGPDWWVFIRTGGTEYGSGFQTEGWLDLSRVCPLVKVRRGAQPNVCTAYEAGGTRRATLARALGRLPVQKTSADAGTLLEQLKLGLCDPRWTVVVWEAPPLLDGLLGLMKEPDFVSDPRGEPIAEVGRIEEEGFCGEVEILARAREVPAGEASSPFGTTVVVPWIRVRLGPPANLEGWIQAIPNCPDSPPGVVLCQFYPDWRGGGSPSQAALRMMEGLRSIPVSPDPSGTSDLAVTARAAPQPGDPCSGDLPAAISPGATVENIGRGSTPPRFTVKVGENTSIVEFLRGVRPGESFHVRADWETTIVVDPNGELDESNTANNKATTPRAPNLICR